jgi:hypothetical protein
MEKERDPEPHMGQGGPEAGSRAVFVLPELHTSKDARKGVCYEP